MSPFDDNHLLSDVGIVLGVGGFVIATAVLAWLLRRHHRLNQKSDPGQLPVAKAICHSEEAERRGRDAAQRMADELKDKS